HGAQDHPGIVLTRQDLASGRRDLALRQDAGGHLVQQRLEQVMSGLRDDRHVDSCALESLRREQAAEARSDHHDLVSGSRALWTGEVAHELPSSARASLSITPNQATVLPMHHSSATSPDPVRPVVVAVVAVGAAAGAVSRYGITELVPTSAHGFPWATF